MNPGGGANGNPDVGQRIGKEPVNEVMMEKIVQQPFVPPSAPNTSGQASNKYGQTGGQNP